MTVSNTPVDGTPGVRPGVEHRSGRPATEAIGVGGRGNPGVPRDMSITLFVWTGFVLLVLLFICLDLGVFHRRAHVQTVPEALGWSAFWIALALAFNVVVYFLYDINWAGVGLVFPEHISGRTAALEFLAGYVLEKSLSLDNIFIIALIFSYFSVPLELQHRVLFWGVLGALVMRGIMIAAGVVLLERFEWMTYLFGIILILTAVRMLVARHDNLEPDRNPTVRLARRLYPVTPDFEGPKFFSRMNGKRAITPLFLVLLLVESTDLLFAVDSIPAVFAVTREPFLVYTSNVFAILGLRSLYFVLAPLLGMFRFLKISLVFVLAFVGVKMLLAHHHPVPVTISLPTIGGILAVGVLASIIAPDRDTAPLESPVRDRIEELLRLDVRAARHLLVLVMGGSFIVLAATALALPGRWALLVIPVGGLILLGGVFWGRSLLGRIRRDMIERRQARREAAS